MRSAMLTALAAFALTTFHHPQTPEPGMLPGELRPVLPVRAATVEAASPVPLDGVEHVAAAIRRCESGGSYTGRDGDLSGRPPRSTASGAYRFIRETWRWTWEGLIGEPAPTVDAKDATPHDQDRAFAALYGAAGLRPWAASRGCWGPVLD